MCGSSQIYDYNVWSKHCGFCYSGIKPFFTVMNDFPASCVNKDCKTILAQLYSVMLTLMLDRFFSFGSVFDSQSNYLLFFGGTFSKFRHTINQDYKSVTVYTLVYRAVHLISSKNLS